MLSVLGDVAAGGGVGLLLGTLLGLSVSPVVQGVVVAITALLGGLLGLSSGQSTGRSLRIAAFGVLATGGILLGLAVRSGGLLAPSPRSEVAAWRNAGYSAEDARAFVAYHRLGIKPPSATISVPADAPEQTNALYADVGQSLCNAIALVSDPAQKLAIVRKFPSFAGIAAAAENSTDPSATLMRELKCGN